MRNLFAGLIGLVIMLAACGISATDGSGDTSDIVRLGLLQSAEISSTMTLVFNGLVTDEITDYDGEMNLLYTFSGTVKNAGTELEYLLYINVTGSDGKHIVTPTEESLI